MGWLPLVVPLILLLCSMRHAAASLGDRSPSFVRCVAHCERTGCTPDAAPIDRVCCEACRQDDGAIPLALRLTRWSCRDDCAYACMHAQEAARRGPGSSPWKYFGKWPFTRVLGMQEVMSVALSLGNLAAHVFSALQLWAHAASTAGPGRHRYPYLWLWMSYAAVHANAWIWSAVFHTRDTRLTERLDYVGANLVLTMGHICVAVQAFWPRHLMAAAALCCAAVGCTAAHLRYMLLVAFDYGWNMQFCIASGVINALAWIAFCQRSQHPHRRTLYCFLALAYAALLLEVLDFPPIWGLLDAHALWHAATIPLVFVFYRFVHGDVDLFAARAKLTAKLN
jgi:hypothetical protein